jgi:hypothetical protein
MSMLDYRRHIYPQREDRQSHKYKKDALDGLLQASGTVPAEEIMEPKQLDAYGEKCLFVVKNGLATGTTVGRLMGMESFTRIYDDEHGTKETSVQIGVLPYGRREGPFSMNPPFSAPGDSGSIVLTREGGIVGMLNSGAGLNSQTDVSYLTPYWYIEDQIKKVFPDCHLYEVVG